MFTLEDARRLRDQIFADTYLLGLADKADQQSKSQSKHGRQHCFDVPELGRAFMTRLEELFPGTISEMDRVLAEIAMFTHDLGRSVQIKDHARYSAQIVGQYLKKTNMPLEYRRMICYAVRWHSAGDCLPPRQVKDNVHALLIIADKLVGDAERVRGSKARRLRSWLAKGLINSKWAEWSAKGQEDPKNNAANFAIKRVRIDIDKNDVPEPRYRGAVLCQMDVDERFATMEQIFSVEWFSMAYHAVARSCQHLGFVFRIEVNGRRYFWSDEHKGWRCNQPIEVPRH